jgi:hypothetical protein
MAAVPEWNILTLQFKVAALFEITTALPVPLELILPLL